MKKKLLNQKGFVATAVLYSLVALLAMILLLILANYKTLRKIEVDTGKGAKRDLSKYTIVYHPTTGTGNMEETTGYYGESLTLPVSTFTKEYANFMGWSLNPDASVVDYQDQATVLNLAYPKGVCDLYAVWKWYEYNIDFVSTATATNMPNPIIKVHGFDITLPTTVPKRTSYTFKGWTTTKNGSRVDYKKGATFALNKDTTLYAVWAKSTQTIASPSFYQTGCAIHHKHGSYSEPSKGECSVSANAIRTFWSFCSSGGATVSARSYSTFNATDFNYATISYTAEGGTSGTASIGSASGSISSGSSSVKLNISGVTGNQPLYLSINTSFNDAHTIKGRSYTVKINSIVLSN